MPHQLLTDQHQTRDARFFGAPLTVEMLIETRAHALDQQAHRLVRNRREAFDPQDAVLHHQLRQRVEQQAFVGLRQFDGDRIEGVVIVVVVITVVMVIVVTVAAVDMLLGAGAEADQHVQRQAAIAGFDDFYRWRQLFGDFSTHPCEIFRAGLVSFVEDHQVSAGQLIGEQFMQRRLVIRFGSSLRWAST